MSHSSNLNTVHYLLHKVLGWTVRASWALTHSSHIGTLNLHNDPLKVLRFSACRRTLAEEDWWSGWSDSEKNHLLGPISEEFIWCITTTILDKNGDILGFDMTWYSGCWWLEHGWLMTFPSYWECHHPKWLSWRTHSPTIIFPLGLGGEKPPEILDLASRFVASSIAFGASLVGNGWVAEGCWDDDITSDEMDHSRKFPT